MQEHVAGTRIFGRQTSPFLSGETTLAARHLACKGNLIDFFTNCLPFVYEESCLIHDGTSHQLVFGWKTDLRKDENRLNLAMLVRLLI